MAEKKSAVKKPRYKNPYSWYQREYFDAEALIRAGDKSGQISAPMAEALRSVLRAAWRAYDCARG